MTNNNNQITTTTTAPNVTVFVEYKDGRKIKYNSKMKKPKVTSPYDYCLKFKAGLFNEVTSVHLNVEGITKWWPVTIMRQSATYVVLTFCGSRLLLETTDHLVPHNPRRVIGYKHIPILDKDGNVINDKFGPKIIIKPIYGTGNTIKCVNLDHIKINQAKRLVQYK